MNEKELYQKVEDFLKEDLQTNPPDEDDPRVLTFRSIHRAEPKTLATLFTVLGDDGWYTADAVAFVLGQAVDLQDEDGLWKSLGGGA